MRKALYTALMGDRDFAELIPELYERGAVVDSPPLPFAVYANVGSLRQGASYRIQPRFELWVYQPAGSYDLINRALARADVVLSSLVEFKVDDEAIYAATPQGWSGDLYDDVYRANTRNSSYIIIGSGW